MSSTYQKGYQKRRGQGGLKGLGTGARSSFKGRQVQQAKNAQRIGSMIIPRKVSSEIKTVDHTFYAAYVAPYVPDILAKTRLNCATNGAMQALMIQQGTGPSQRVGNSCNLKSIRLRFRITSTAFAEATNSMMRMMLIYDKQPNGAYPATSALLAALDEAGTTSAFDPDGDLNVANIDRFVVLMDEYHMVQPTDIATTSLWNLNGPTDSKCFLVDRFIKLKGLEQKYSATSSPMVIGNQTTGALYILSVGSVATGGEPFCWHGKARLRFWDV